MPSSPQPSNSSASNSTLPRWKKGLFAVVTFALFFGGTELILWFAGVETVIQREDPFRGFSGRVSIFESDGERYRTARIEGPKTFNDQSFLVDKPAAGIRVFVVGGSSAYGFPWGGKAAFAAILAHALAEAHPDRLVEVVNVSAVSYAMHRIQIIVKELVQYQPDLLIVYSGHNEFVERGAFEALREQSATSSELNYIMAHSRLYSLLKLAKTRVEESAARRLHAVVSRDESRRFSEEEKKAAVADYETGLRNVVRWSRDVGSKVLLSTVPANVAEWRPQASGFAEPLSEQQLLQWVAQLERTRAMRVQQQLDDAQEAVGQALGLAPSHAETRYESAEVRRARKEWGAAREEYRLACDLDVSPVRALSGINDAVRRIAADEKTLFVDSEALFESLSPNRLVGLNVIEDYVHPTRAGHVEIAWAMFNAIEGTGWWGPVTQPVREPFDALVKTSAAAVDERNATWFFNQGYLLANQGRTDEAIEKYREALRVSKTHSGAMANLAACLVERGELQEARQLSQEILQLDPRDAKGHLSLGNILFREGRAQEAIAELREALELAPELLNARVNLGRILLGEGEFQEAETQLNRVLEADSKHGEALIARGQVLQMQEKLDAAESSYRAAIAVSPDSATARTGLALCLSDRGQHAEADALWRTAAALATGAATAVVVASDLVKGERFEDAVSVLERLVTGGSNDVRVHELLGFALQKLNRLPEALVHLRKAMELTPDSISNVRNVGIVQLKLGQGAAAEATFRGAVTKHGRSIELLSNLGIALATQGKWNDAAIVLQEVVDLDPTSAAAKQRLQEALKRRSR